MVWVAVKDSLKRLRPVVMGSITADMVRFVERQCRDKGPLQTGLLWDIIAFMVGLEGSVCWGVAWFAIHLGQCSTGVNGDG